MSELILHIGMPKTGSSALQAFFGENRELLAAHGVDFPLFTEQLGNTVNANGYFLKAFCMNASSGTRSSCVVNDFEENWELLSERLHSSSRVLLSDEVFFFVFTGKEDRRGRVLDFWRVLAESLRELGAESVRIVVYLRPQHEILASWWKQRISDGWKSVGFPEFIKESEERLFIDYDHRLEIIEEAFEGNLTLVPRVYRAGLFKGDAIIRDFCEAASIPWDEAYRQPFQVENPSISFDVAEAARAFSYSAPGASGLRTGVVRPLLHELSAERPEAPGLNPYSPEQLQQLAESVADSNRRLFERWFDGKDVFGPFEAAGPRWEPDQAWIAECRKRIDSAIRSQGTAEWLSGKAMGVLRVARAALVAAVPADAKRLIRRHLRRD